MSQFEISAVFFLSGGLQKMVGAKSVATFSRYAGWAPTEGTQMRLADDWAIVAWIIWILLLFGSLAYAVFYA
jgi:hypothetical protein